MHCLHIFNLLDPANPARPGLVEASNMIDPQMGLFWEEAIWGTGWTGWTFNPLRASKATPPPFRSSTSLGSTTVWVSFLCNGAVPGRSVRLGPVLVDENRWFSSYTKMERIWHGSTPQSDNLAMKSVEHLAFDGLMQFGSVRPPPLITVSFGLILDSSSIICSPRCRTCCLKQWPPALRECHPCFTPTHQADLVCPGLLARSKSKSKEPLMPGRDDKPP